MQRALHGGEDPRPSILGITLLPKGKFWILDPPSGMS
jgi:hypothetical protein